MGSSNNRISSAHQREGANDVKRKFERSQQQPRIAFAEGRWAARRLRVFNKEHRGAGAWVTAMARGPRTVLARPWLQSTGVIALGPLSPARQMSPVRRGLVLQEVCDGADCTC